MKLIWKRQNTSHFCPKEFISWATLTYSTSGALYWMKQLFIIKTNYVKNGCSSPHEHLRFNSGFKMSFEHNSVRKNLFLSARFCWDSRPSLRKMDQIFIFGGTIGYSWSSCFVISNISKYLNYKQNYMMLLEQCRRIVTKVQATVTRLGEDQIHVCSVTWLEYCFAFT